MSEGAVAGDVTPVPKKISSRRAVSISSMTALMTALVFVVTVFPPLRIPFPATGGYFNFGDIIIFTAAFAFGPTVAGFAGGVGSSLSDAVSGSANFAPFTLVIKGLEGFAAGFIAQRKFRGSELIGWLVGAAILVVGYFLTVAVLYGLPAAIFPELPGDIIQGVSGGIGGLFLSFMLKKLVPETYLRRLR